MVPHFIAISLLMLLLTPGSMLSVFDSPARAQCIVQLPAAQVYLTPENGRCIRFEHKAGPIS
ncbi:hypothetical protein [Bradyrhizobium sp. SYSU BS000235]|uniref:hypothetical protein n=1 Tax=Bradyrhizobium sp. SYSU BS000235 TaxID=3411332 RepID=UPI003C74F682